GGARGRQPALAHCARAHPAQHHAGAPRPGDAVDRGRHHRRGEPVVPRPRPAATGALVGQHAQFGAALPGQRALDGGMAGARDLPDRAVVQSGGRRPARRARSARALTDSLATGSNDMKATHEEQKILDWLAEQRPAMLALLGHLVNTDSGSYDKAGVDAVGERIRGFLDANGIAHDTVAHERYGDAIRATIGGGEQNSTILLMGHRDTVFPKGEAA